MNPIPEHLIKNALVVGRVKREVTMENQDQRDRKKDDCTHNNSSFLRHFVQLQSHNSSFRYFLSLNQRDRHHLGNRSGKLPKKSGNLWYAKRF